MTPAPPLSPYTPPTGDEPLDAIEQALVRMWIDIIAAEIRDELAAARASESPREDDRPVVLPQRRTG
jgi:hypothetical protein